MLVLGATWPYMTPAYVYDEMTYPEIGSALEYVYRYVEPTPASKSGKKYKTMDGYIERGKDTFRQDVKQMVSKIPRKGRRR